MNRLLETVQNFAAFMSRMQPKFSRMFASAFGEMPSSAFLAGREGLGLQPEGPDCQNESARDAPIEALSQSFGVYGALSLRAA